MTAPVLYTLYDLLVDALRQLYAAEQEHLRALPRMATAAQTPELVRVFNDHLGETEEQVSRLERIFAHLEECPEGGTCAGMDGVLLECDSLILTQGHPDVLNAALISAAHRVEHYEMAAYGTARVVAELLGEEAITQLLEASYREEQGTDRLLNLIATRKVNQRALTASAPLADAVE